MHREMEKIGIAFECDQKRVNVAKTDVADECGQKCRLERTVEVRSTT